MGAFFARLRGGGGGSEPPAGPSRVSEQDRAILQLKRQRDELNKYQKRINTQIEREKGVAKKLIQDGKKDRAKLLLKKKRYLEGLLDKTDTQIDNLMQMVETLEYTQIEMKVVEGLKQGNECLQEMHKIMSLEDVEKIMDETQDAIAYQQEIDELLGQNLTGEDEEAIAAELENILTADIPEVPVTAEIPEVPTHEPGALEEEETEKEKKKEQALEVA
ncbi:PREDICTED: charged multivesicular body protein 6-A-like [Amphimedon queenslandica]|uniref:Charged multivesicular body protein 6 n=1 Tax=Amphimedon queenslandica TaxID=400682 RepID=A0A1X7UJG8_AMPQE|nr:PREDICTED: charged multivesicular body protein 6-A-like [Amphimedon queenslandica]|eukprot:XP_003387668.1 PREDICTED: charged multivesicular body protein 6-A-like [Amphimedon queenslandica]